MPRLQHKNTINNKQDSMSPIKPHNLTTVRLENCYIAEGQEKAFMNVTEWKRVKSLNEIHENASKYIVE